MTDVELTPQAEDHLEPLDSEARERILKKLGEAQEWTEHRLKPLSNYPYYTLRAGTTGRSSPGIGRRMS